MDTYQHFAASCLHNFAGLKDGDILTCRVASGDEAFTLGKSYTVRLLPDHQGAPMLLTDDNKFVTGTKSRFVWSRPPKPPVAAAAVGNFGQIQEVEEKPYHGIMKPKPDIIPPVQKGPSDRKKVASDGGSTGYYALPPHATELRHLISHKGMSKTRGDIFKACYRLGEKDGVDVAYDLNKIKFFIQDLIEMHERGEHL